MSKVRVELDLPKRENVGRIQDLVSEILLSGGFSDDKIEDWLDEGWAREELRDALSSFLLAFMCSRRGRPVYNVDVGGKIRKYVLLQSDVDLTTPEEFLRHSVWSTRSLEATDEEGLRLFVEAHPYIRHEFILTGGTQQKDGSYEFHAVRIKGRIRDFDKMKLKHLTQRYHYLAEYHG